MTTISNEENKVVYVGDVSSSVDEESLYKLFGPPKYGKIEKMILKQSKRPNRTLQFAFITYENHEDAEKVVSEMNSYLLDGIQIRVLFSEPNFEKIRSNFNENITIQNISPLIKQKTLIDMFKEYGEIFSCKIPKGKDGELFGVAYIQYTEQRFAQAAIAAMNGKEINGQIITVKKYNPLDRSPNLFIKQGIPLEIATNKDLINWLEQIFSENGKQNQIFANIDKTVLLLLPDNPNFRQAFVTFLDCKLVNDAMKELRSHGLKCEHVATSEKIKRMKNNSEYWDKVRREKMSHIIYIKNFPEDFNKKNIENLFSNYPDYEKCDLKSTTDYPYAFIHFTSKKAAINAIENSTLICFEPNKNEEKESSPNQLFVSYYVEKGDKNKNKTNENHQSKINERQLGKKVIFSYGKESIQCHRFTQLSPEQINALAENEELYNKWANQDKFIPDTVADEDNEKENDVNEKNNNNTTKHGFEDPLNDYDSEDGNIYQYLNDEEDEEDDSLLPIC